MCVREFRLLQDRELSLMDGSKLLSHDNYESTKTFAGLTDEDMAQRFALIIIIRNMKLQLYNTK